MTRPYGLAGFASASILDSCSEIPLGPDQVSAISRNCVLSRSVLAVEYLTLTQVVSYSSKSGTVLEAAGTVLLGRIKSFLELLELLKCSV